MTVEIKEIKVSYSNFPSMFPCQVTVSVDGELEYWRVTGHCSRCGACCRALGCKKSVDEKRNGVKESPCAEYWTRPFNCVAYPINPYDPLHEGCTFHWSKLY